MPQPARLRGDLADSARLVRVQGPALLHPERAVFDAMLAGWRAQQRSRAARQHLVVPGTLPGRPITPARLGQRLAQLGIDCQTGRRAAMLELASTVPAVVLADLLGIHTTTADRAHAAGGDCDGSSYAAEIARTRAQTVPNPSETVR